MNLVEYVCDGVLLGRYYVPEDAPFSVDSPWPWPKGTVMRVWTNDDGDQPQIFPVYAEVAE